MTQGVVLEVARSNQGGYEQFESPAQFMERLVFERPEFAAPCGKIAEMIDRGVPSADSYPAVFQEFYDVAGRLPVAFPERLRRGVSLGMHELLGDSLYATAHHLDHANTTDAVIPLSKGKTLPVQLYGTQPLEDLHTFTQVGDRAYEVISDPDVGIVDAVDNPDYHLYRFIDLAHPGAPAVLLYIRPRAGYCHDRLYEYGKSRGIDPSISLRVDTRPLNHLAKSPFLGEVFRQGMHAESVFSVRTDRDGYTEDDWHERSRAGDPMLQQGTVAFDGGALFGSDRAEVRVGRLFAYGNMLRSQAEGTPLRWNHVLPFDQSDGDADNFAQGAEELIARLEDRRISYRDIRRAMTKKTVATNFAETDRPTVVSPRAVSHTPTVQLHTADEVLEWSGQFRTMLQAEIQEDTILHQLIAKRYSGFNFSTQGDGPLFGRAADILAPYDRTAPRWELLHRESRVLTDEEEQYFIGLARRVGMITTAGFHAAIKALPNTEKVIYAEGGANETSVVRSENACDLADNDPSVIVRQGGSGRRIPKYLYNGQPNPEYEVVTSERVAGGVLPPAMAYSEHQVNVASALQRGWVADIPASEQLRRTMRGVSDVAVLRSDFRPDMHVIKPEPARHGRATVGMGVRALAATGILGDGENLIIPTTSQYVPKTTIQAARILKAMGLGDTRVQAIGCPGASSADVYRHETAVLLRLLEAA